MFGKRIKKNLRRPRGKNLISSNRIKPDAWHISPTEVKVALKAAGFDVQEIKKIRLLKYQICISYWNHKGGVCSGFFSYRLFPTWHKVVEKLIENCPNLKGWGLLNHIMLREFKYYPYPVEMEDALHNALQNRLYVLKATARQAISNDVAGSSEWEYLEYVILNA
ncbi:MAG: hypothetical protein AAFW70_03960 [Cyanobacteria bacterium J06635_10]